MRRTYFRGIVTQTAWLYHLFTFLTVFTEHRFLLFLPVEHKHDYDSSYIYFIAVTRCNIMAKSQGTVCDCESALQKLTQTTVCCTFVQLKQPIHPSIHTFSITTCPALRVHRVHDGSSQRINIERQTSTLAITSQRSLHVFRLREDVGVCQRNPHM